LIYLVTPAIYSHDGIAGDLVAIMRTAPEWQAAMEVLILVATLILAECPGIKPVHVTGFKSKTEIDEWMNGEGRIAWLRSQGYAK